ncbi:MAG TPA: flagellar FliJ family protein [Fimbriimonas sp.]|nr:flagellar FliJ family protein [Fimbriimonas sp.]
MFRLQKVFEYRELEEQWAKENFISRQATRMAAVDELFGIESDRRLLLSAGADDLAARRELEMRLAKLDDYDRAARILIHQLEQEEEQARSEWLLKKQEKSALEKLRDRAYVSWAEAQNRKEAAALDEWATQRRKVA